MIEIRRYRVGRTWTRLSAGWRKRRVAVSAAGTGTGSRGRGARSGAAGDSDGWGLDDRLVDSTPKRFGGGGGLFSRQLSIVADPRTAMAGTVGIGGIE